MSVTLRLKGIVGCSIDHVAAGACNVARKIGICVEVDFNNTILLVSPSDFPERVAAAYRLALARGLGVASSDFPSSPAAPDQPKGGE